VFQLTSQSASNQTPDAIIVLGAAVLAGGRPSAPMSRRVRHAVDLFYQRRADCLILTGGVGKNPPAEAEVMGSMAILLGVPESCLILETRSRSTFESAKNCAALMHRIGWSKAIVVSDAYHLLRARMIFYFKGVHVIGSAAPGGARNTAQWKWVYYYLREVVAVLWYLFLIVADRLHRKKNRNTGCA
jgi:uncharacterized SAM-binding protein YcdF (DUF218 family)